MEGPWDQYATAEAGPWDQYKAAPSDSAKPQIGIGEDLGNAAKAAPGRAAASLLGLPGDLYHLGLRALGDNLTPRSNYGSEAIRQSLGSDYQAQRLPGQLLEKTADFAPAMIGGPESLALKAATRVAAPVIGSQVGKEVAGPYGEVAGALLGAGGASAAARRFQQMGTARRAANDLPDLADIRMDARGNYQHPEVQGLRINPNATEALAGTIEHDLQHGANSGFRAANEPGVFNAVNELRLAQQEGRASTVADLDSVRQVLRNLGKERDAQGQLTRQAVSANRAARHIDDFLPNLNQADLLAGDATRANELLADARRNWNQYKKGQEVERLLGNAQLNAASANSGANIQNATKQAFKPLLRNNEAKARSMGFNDEEVAALNQVVRGTWAGSAARAAGNLLGGGGGLGMLASGAAGYEAGGPAGAIAAGLAGRGLKMVGNASTMRAVRDLDRLVRSNSPVAIRVAAQNPQLAQQLPAGSLRVLTAMIAANPALRQQMGQPVGQPRAQ
jgi:hypothetical protein